MPSKFSLNAIRILSSNRFQVKVRVRSDEIYTGIINKTRSTEFSSTLSNKVRVGWRERLTRSEKNANFGSNCLSLLCILHDWGDHLVRFQPDGPRAILVATWLLWTQTPLFNYWWVILRLSYHGNHRATSGKDHQATRSHQPVTSLHGSSFSSLSRIKLKTLESLGFVY